ncbi:MAG: hypothetical protein HYX57_07085 [Chloroflexi bacterium]|nr:hypothetical protein [Chloroflexota bacterium]
MTRRPTSRGVSLVASTALLALTLLVPAGASAAIPDLIRSSAPAPATISAGGRGAVIFGIYNNDKSTVSQLYLVNVAITGGSIVGLYPSQGTCAATCSLGQLKPRKAATVTVVFDASAGASSVNVTGIFNTTGLGSGGGDQSHGDDWPVAQSVATSSDSQDFGGRFVDAANDVVVQNLQAVGTTNPQATKVIAPQTMVGVSVEDGGTATCPATITCFGEASVIEVAGGATFPGGFRVVITMDSSELPSGVNAKNIKIYHAWDGGSENIFLRCSFANGLPKSMPCLNAVKVNGNDLQVTIWTTHNGIMRGNA